MKKEYFIVRVSKELKDKAQKRAEEKYTDLSEYIRSLVVKDLENK